MWHVWQALYIRGERWLLVGGALVAAAGALAAVTTSTLWVALAGFVVVGLGLANVFPLAIAKAGLLGGARGIALATTVGYTGLLGGPPPRRARPLAPRSRCRSGHMLAGGVHHLFAILLGERAPLRGQ